MKVCICDDIEEYRISIHMWIEQFFKQHFIEYSIDEFASLEELSSEESIKKYDLFFLDIEFGESVTGLDLIDEIREKNKKAFFIIITAYNHYLDRAMDLNVLRFINKPINYERLKNALERAIDCINQSILSLRLKDGETVFINKQDIIFAEAKFKKTFITTTSRGFECQLPFKDFKELLVSPDYLIPHNSYIVNRNYIVSLKRNSIVMKDKDTFYSIPIAATKQSHIKKQFSI